MVATLVRLRFLLLFNGLKTSVWQIVLLCLGVAYGLGVLVVLLVGLFTLGFGTVELARTILVLGGAIAIFGWTVIPVLTSGVDQTVDPARLAVFPVPLDRLLLALAVSGVLGIPGIVTSIAALGTALTWRAYPLAVFAALVSAVIGVLTAVVGSRMLAALATRVGSGRRAREAKGILVFIPLLLAGPITLGVAQLVRNFSGVFPVIADVVSWTPLGAVWAIPADVAVGDFAAAGLHLLIALATLAGATALWRWGLGRSLEQPAQPAAVKAGTRGAGFFDLFPGTPAGAVAARALTYWVRDPRYAQSLVSVPLIPVLFFFYGGLNDNLGILVWVGPVVAVLLAMSIFTDVSYDNTAFALHLQTGVSGRADRLGRVVALAVFAVPVTLALTVASVWFTDQWELLPGLLGVCTGLLLSGFAISSVVSGRFTFPVPAPGDSPFKARPGGGTSLMISTFVTWTALGIAVLPELVLAIVGFASGDLLYGWLSILVGAALGSVLLVIGIRVGGGILDRRGPELLGQLQRQK